MASKTKTAVAVKQEETGTMLETIPFDRSKIIKALEAAPRVQAATPFITMNGKTGVWGIGQEKKVPPKGARFAVHPGGFCHGIVAWRDTEKYGGNPSNVAQMVPVSEPMPARGPIPPESRGWETQLGALLIDMGTREGLRFLSSSLGGVKGIQELRDNVLAQIRDDDVNVIALVELASRSYVHPSRTRGTIYEPRFTVVGWASFAQLEKNGAKKAVKA
jgi:hypothetical protein